MKPFISIISGLLFVLCFNTSYSQSDNFQMSGDALLKKVIPASETIVEGHVLSVNPFHTKTGIYTSAIIRVSKLFKGHISDTILEIVFEGGSLDGVDESFSNGAFYTYKNDEGVFFISSNKTGYTRRTDSNSYLPSFGQLSFIAYHAGAAKVANHVATCAGVTYDDLENDLFQRIEALTHTPRKVLGQNMFERSSPKKK
jgi:hypothetical protein